MHVRNHNMYIRHDTEGDTRPAIARSGDATPPLAASRPEPSGERHERQPAHAEGGRDVDVSQLDKHRHPTDGEAQPSPNVPREPGLRGVHGNSSRTGRE